MTPLPLEADAPLTPDEERALREAWPRTAKALRAMAQRANSARGTSWEHGAMCATHLLNAVGAVGHLLATLDEVRAERSAAKRAIDDLRADAGAVVSDLHCANQLGPCGEVRQVAIERAIAALRAAVLGGDQ